MDTDQPATFQQTLGVLQELGQAWRGDWSLDGRSGRAAIDLLTDQLDLAHRTGRARMSVVGMRASTPLCEHGLGHWNEYCDEDCERLAVQGGSE